MRVGKPIKTITSPKREIRKAGERGKTDVRIERPIPVELPKVPEKVPERV